MAAKMKALEEQHQDYQRHIAVLKESLCAKEEHYSMLQTDVSEQDSRNRGRWKMRQRKNVNKSLSIHITRSKVIQKYVFISYRQNMA